MSRKFVTINALLSFTTHLPYRMRIEMLTIYNDLTNKKEPFFPINPPQVKMYVCGMTVYDFCHLGHARVMIVFDMVHRYLQHLGYQVIYIRNVTDIDDKIIHRAAINNEPFTELTSRFIEAMHEDTNKLNVLPPTLEPRATEYIENILDMITRLINLGHAYVSSNGDVYYSVSSFTNYGRLSGKTIDDLLQSNTLIPDENKRSSFDFCLWKSAKVGEPSWESPWGPGRPGWHIECSAMSTSILGNHFDIHGGGIDLQFPHHENEIAQSEGATGEKFVNFWMHNGFVKVNNEKMCKSLGNFFTIRDILQNFRAEEIRYFILSSHYRSSINYDDENLIISRNALTRMYTALRNLPPTDSLGDNNFRKRFIEAMNEDFNTPEAIAVLFDLVREINRKKNENELEAAALGAELKYLGGILGILQENPEVYLKNIPYNEIEIRALIEKRTEARRIGQWEEADRIRIELLRLNIRVEDGPTGTTWRQIK